MKRVAATIFSCMVLLLCVVSSSATAQTMDSSTLFPPEWDGTMRPYDFSSTDSVVPWGEDMQPVFINYIARHGARFLSSSKKTSSLKKILLEARAGGTLSEKGECFLRLINKVDSATDGRWGALNTTGIGEERRLAEEMTRIAPGLLGKGKISAIATYVPRVVMTMYEFCHTLACYSTELEISTSEGQQFDTLLRYFKTDSAYINFLKHPDWKDEYERFAKSTLPTSPAASMFTIGKETETLQHISLAAYEILQSLRASDIEADYSIWFTPRDYRRCWEVDNLEHYYARSDSRFSFVPTVAARPLLESIIRSTDEAAQWRNEDVAMLRFGHAETLLPLFTLMRLPGCYAPEADSSSLAGEWVDSNISPLGANLMIVVLKNRNGKSFVALRLNGKWIATGGKKVTEWNVVKPLWESFLSD